MGAGRLVVITGMGVVSPIGASVAEIAASLRETRSGIRCIQAPPLMRAYPAAVVPGDPGKHFSALELVYLDRCQQLALLAARDAIADAGLERFDQFASRAAM